jgi:hypothetical protein
MRPECRGRSQHTGSPFQPPRNPTASSSHRSMPGTVLDRMCRNSCGTRPHAHGRWYVSTLDRLTLGRTRPCSRTLQSPMARPRPPHLNSQNSVWYGGCLGRFTAHAQPAAHRVTPAIHPSGHRTCQIVSDRARNNDSRRDVAPGPASRPTCSWPRLVGCADTGRRHGRRGWSQSFTSGGTICLRPTYRPQPAGRHRCHAVGLAVCAGRPRGPSRRVVVQIHLVVERNRARIRIFVGGPELLGLRRGPHLLSHAATPHTVPERVLRAKVCSREPARSRGSKRNIPAIEGIITVDGIAETHRGLAAGRWIEGPARQVRVRRRRTAGRHRRGWGGRRWWRGRRGGHDDHDPAVGGWTGNRSMIDYSGDTARRCRHRPAVGWSGEPSRPSLSRTRGSR